MKKNAWMCKYAEVQIKKKSAELIPVSGLILRIKILTNYRYASAHSHICISAHLPRILINNIQDHFILLQLRQVIKQDVMLFRVGCQRGFQIGHRFVILPFCK